MSCIFTTPRHINIVLDHYNLSNLSITTYYHQLSSAQLSSALHPTNLHTDFDPNMPPSFIYRKAFQACWRLDRILLPRPPPQAYLAFLRSRPSSINRMKVWWWNKTPMGRNLFVIAPWSVATHVWFYRLLWKS